MLRIASPSRVSIAAALFLIAGTHSAGARPLPIFSLGRPVEAVPLSEISPIVAADTSWYGGTVWAADSNRWEAIPGGSWTFQSGVGSAIQNVIPASGKPNGYNRLMEGWRGV